MRDRATVDATLLRRARAHPYLAFQVLRDVDAARADSDLVLRASRRERQQPRRRLHERVLADLLRRNEENYFL